MYSVKLDENNYFTGTYTEIGSIEGGVLVQELPPDLSKFGCYKLENDIWILDSEKLELFNAQNQQNVIRQKRIESFSLIDKYQLTLVFESLTEDQQKELSDYREGWLNAPETMIIPEKPEWMK